MGGPVLDGQALDVADDDPSAGDLVLQEVGQDPLGFGGDRGADAIAGQDADPKGLDPRIIDPVGHGFDLGHALHLDLEEPAEMLLGPVDDALIHELSSRSEQGTDNGKAFYTGPDPKATGPGRGSGRPGDGRPGLIFSSLTSLPPGFIN